MQLPGKSKSSVFCRFLQIFFYLPDLLVVLSSRKLNNNCITFFAGAIAGFNVIRRNTETDFVKNIQYFLLQYFPLPSRGMPTMSGHSRLAYCAFDQHCRSKVTNLLDNNVLTFFVIDSLELSLVIVSENLRASSRTLLLTWLLASSSLLYREKTIEIRSCLRSFSSESLLYDATFQLDRLSNKKLHIEKLVN